MTAEIAILNKTAVVLAADSAVTISAGSSQEKIYDSADKLFELSMGQPIGIMINNDMNFMETPLPVIIKKYRSEGREFNSIVDAAEDFLRHLHDFGRKSPESIRLRHLDRHVRPLIVLVRERSQRALQRLFASSDESITDRPFSDVMHDLISEEIAVVGRALSQTKIATFFDDGEIALSEAEKTAVATSVEEELSVATDEQREAVCNLISEHITRIGWRASSTGLVVAGFGSKETFPTLVSFELFGIIAGRLKYSQNNLIDIDRDGDRAKVLPFAQREMVERFLYGLDEGIERKITQFCEMSVPDIAAKLIQNLDMPDEDRDSLIQDAKEAEQGFYDGLAQRSFAAIRQQSELEIEDMVEFMPKPEMARMAEALVNLTSIKRRVSRGMETVGGPIDVAVISQAEGFVWVKRKHYFPPELNQRFFGRMKSERRQCREAGDA
ncbi:MAG: hypothetical protein U0S50_00865 [Sphingopyxis sp.]|uniref:hypothetical protein n=1 Tax=Sphingopyxis sp. TaxID=1908224 RepID=UPI002ABC367E|nr:hypothetical protein [Sphingopyxis sp.]MDZ3830350.1 hypothetical protein [Sphingopyxis sp.]